MYFDVLWQVHVVIIWKMLSGLTHILRGAQLGIREIHKVAVGLTCHLLTSWLLQFVIIYHSLLYYTTKNTHVVPFCEFFATTFDIWCCSHLHFIANKSKIKWSPELLTFFPSIHTPCTYQIPQKKLSHFFSFSPQVIICMATSLSLYFCFLTKALACLIFLGFSYFLYWFFLFFHFSPLQSSCHILSLTQIII